ncbi:MAG: cation diffusion facilitator family transporter [Gemmatimonadota bacterium]
MRRPPGAHPALHGQRVRRVLLLTLAANVIVVLAKAAAGLASGSLAVLADAGHSSVDAWNNVVALALAAVAAQPPDERHPYGHAKFETLGALAVVAFLSIGIFELVESALGRLAGRGEPPVVGPFVVGVMAASAVVSLVVSTYEDRRGRELDSQLLRADAAHTRADVYASLAVLGGLGLVALGYPAADALLTLVVAAIIARAAWQILRRAVPVLVDERAVEEDAIRATALATEGVRACFDIRSRGSAGAVFVELTVTVAPALTVVEGHRIADVVERRVAEAIGATEVVVHVEPADT